MTTPERDRLLAGSARGDVRRLLKHTCARLGLIAYGRRPLRSWPSFLGTLLDVKLPSNVRRKYVSSPEGGANINIILELIDGVIDKPGDLAECGVYRGATAIPIALHLAQQRSGKTLYGFDSFAGFDADILVDLRLGGAADKEKQVGGFAGTSLDYVAGRAALAGAGRSLVLRPGYFKQSLGVEPERRYCFVHLDCDTYLAYQQCLAYFYPRLVDGGIVLLDEYRDPPWPGCDRAVDEFLADKREVLERIERNNYEKYYFRKLPAAGLAGRAHEAPVSALEVGARDAG